MSKETREAFALIKHQIISPVLMGSGRAQMKYFRELENREFDVPGRGLRKFKASTLKGWLTKYRKHGFAGLQARERTDRGRFRKMPLEMQKQVIALREEHLDLSVVRFYERLNETKVLGNPPLCIETLRRFLKSKSLYRRREPQARKRFEMSRFGELWVGDFMHGPLVLDYSVSQRKRKAILMAIIDDHSRMIVGASFGFTENTQLLEAVFKEAILTHGLPDRLYVDNGASFSSEYLRRVCAHLGIGLVHSKPYDSPSRGKIERFFRTVRESLLDPLCEGEDLGLDLKTLNEVFRKWLRDCYHHRNHSGIAARPIDRYQISMSQYPLKRIDEERLQEFFMVSAERLVHKDSTVSLDGIIYELPVSFIGRKVELRYPQDRPQEVYLYCNGERHCRVLPVDAIANGKTYKPSPRYPQVPLQEVLG